MFGLDTGLTLLLIFCLLAACAFEFINGFHDTANAVATVIYTHSLKPQTAVILSGICNFIGVYIGGIAVAMGIVNLLPMEMLVDNNVYHGVAMIMALILTAIIWNLWTWYLGLPCSSSHTLIGSIFGVGLAYMLLPGGHSVSLNWSKAADVGLSLMISPIFGFGLALLLMWILKKTVKNKAIFKEPPKKKAPPLWIRSILILTCTSVSFSHGSNDGQKGVGLIMIILIAIVPSYFALDSEKRPDDLLKNITQIERHISQIDSAKLSSPDQALLALVKTKTAEMRNTTAGCKSFKARKDTGNFEIRRDLLIIGKKTEELIKHYKGSTIPGLTVKDQDELKKVVGNSKTFTEYAPWWVIFIVSISLGLGTMVGWKQIVVTIGEKIGKTNLTYAQGASAQLVASSTIIASTFAGLPVSTTHVLSSGVAGTMVASDGVQNLQFKTIKNILIAWVITLPVTILLSGFLFMLFRLFMG